MATDQTTQQPSDTEQLVQPSLQTLADRHVCLRCGGDPVETEYKGDAILRCSGCEHILFRRFESDADEGVNR